MNVLNKLDHSVNNINNKYLSFTIRWIHFDAIIIDLLRM